MEALSNYLSHYSQLLLFYIPIGIIGFWRWGVWAVRKVISFFYRPPKGDYKATFSVVVPVYNENPKMFEAALHSWKSNKPDEIIAVIDYTDKNAIEVFENFSKSFIGAKMIVTKKPGKRPALVDGTRAASGEIVALVDSDTVWSPDIKAKLLGPFADPEVGGIVTRQDVLKPNTLARRLFKILLDDRYLFEYPFLAAVSDAILCLSGRTSVYRKVAIIDELEKLENEKFWGDYMISGDDKSLTNFIHAKGWKTRYLRDVKIYTNGTPDLFGYLKQKVRWTRNGLRSDSRVLLSGWLWKRHKMLALHMLDKLISPITLLIGLAYFMTSLYLGHWQIALIIAGWWIVSRTVKILPHLRERPLDIFILPAYIIMTFVIAIIKIYATITINKQGWITRWDKSRLRKFAFFESLFTQTATAMVVLGLFFLVFSYKNFTLKTFRLEKLQARELRGQDFINNQRTTSIFTPEKNISNTGELENIKNKLIEENGSDPYAYYVIKSGDTLSFVQRKFNLSSIEKILNAETKEPIPALKTIEIGDKVAISVEELHTPISPDLLNYFSETPRVTYDEATNTIFVKQGGSVVNLARINLLLAPINKKLLEQIVPGEWILRANLYIGEDVTLILDSKEVTYLKLKSTDDSFVWLRSENGSVLISNTKIFSWDEIKNTPDFDYENGRAYVTAKNSGRMDILNSELAYLGYSGAPSRGGPFGGSYGVSWKIKSGALYERMLTGIVVNSRFHDNYFGAYTYGVTGMIFSENEFYDNIEYGLDPHDDSNNLLIENNKAYQNGNHGIIISRRCFNNNIVNNISHNNRLHGIMIDRDSNNNLVQGNIIYGNVDGIAIYESNRNIFIENKVQNNVRGIRLNEGSSENFFENNSVNKNSRGVYIYNQAQKNTLINNGIVDNEIGITIKNANQNILLNNFNAFENAKDGRITNDAYENIIQ